MSKIFRAVMLGAPASGKGTISQRIVQKFGFIHISMGDILRVNIENNTKLGKEAKQYIQNGQLVPDNLVIRCILGRTNEIGNRSWLLDGFPRTTAQAEQLKAEETIDAVINLQVPKSVILERALGRWIHLPSGRVYNIGFNEPKVPYKDDLTGEGLVQRTDDNPATLEKRLELYEQATIPVIEYYRKMNLIYDFSGQTTDEIWPKIEDFLIERTRLNRSHMQVKRL